MISLGSVHDLVGQPDVQELLAVHPNDAQADHIAAAIAEWPDWRVLVDPTASHPLLAAIRTAQLPRNPIDLHVRIPQSPFGMSPKKHHEVSRMTQYIADLVGDTTELIRIVDVGAGQGYLTRALHAHFSSLTADTHTLALDSDHVQTHGAHRRGGQSVPRLTHRTIHLDAPTLVQAIDEWIPTTTATTAPVPVILVALHACGTLTPDLFRAVFSLSPTTDGPSWYPAAVIAVGCCYNLMTPPLDFPLSSLLSTHPNPLLNPLPASAYQMAAQIPDHWHDSPANLARAELAIRKVVWRALLGRLYDRVLGAADEGEAVVAGEITETGSTPAMRRLGRLPDSAYDSWPAFLALAGKRVGVNFLSFSKSLSSPMLAPTSPPSSSSPASSSPFPSDPSTLPNDPPNLQLQSTLASLHVLRCLLGPVVESYIVLDRVQWIREELNRQLGLLKGYEIEAVNLFDQATGSGRNIALVLAPRRSP
ncbi:hypothetical protein DXG03_004955 [Asterophora parasitica]|uniref:Methyltransferase domain-containing protein n=1 Tax=Asterophora parasitica TaxID=117018 RepID=A0A9P7GEB9_9AGAR|nr:hypothetical protein DXG03_004955 [Asterophora parasitica]